MLKVVYFLILSFIFTNDIYFQFKFMLAQGQHSLLVEAYLTNYGPKVHATRCSNKITHNIVLHKTHNNTVRNLSVQRISLFTTQQLCEGNY